MRKEFVWFLRNAVRIVIYRVYSIYKRYLESKVSVYDLQTIDVIQTLPADAVCVDIGTNKGQILQYLYHHCKNGKIHGVEPIPELHDYLKRKFSNPRLTMHQCALSDHVGEVEFFYFPGQSAMSGLSKRGSVVSGECKNIRVRLETLDALIQESRLDFIKIDVEGAELSVLKGAEGQIRKHQPIIVFESGLGGLEFFGGNPEQIAEFFRALEYSVSTMRYYLNGKEPMTDNEFTGNFLKGYDYQYIAYPRAR